MKRGDVVKMKYVMFWMLKNRPGRYTEQPALLIEEPSDMKVRVMFEDGRIMRDLAEHWEVIPDA